VPAAQKAGRPASLLRLSTTALLVVGLLGSSTGSAVAAPAPPVAQPVALEVAQPYIGQSICDPVAKPGVRAFANLLLSTYPATTSLGIVKDCGAGGQSEHKEGRAFDWGASYYNAAQRANVNDALTWLTATDRNGNQAAMARRVGLMYMIWNNQIWRAYDSRGWQPYSGSNPHTDHVHFSFGWNGAKKVTSFWDGTVAPLDYGPAQPAPPISVSPVADKANLAILRSYGGLTLSQGSTGPAVAVVQRALNIADDGSYGPQSATAVSTFQRSQGVSATGSVTSSTWRLLFPPPINPFGSLDAVRVDLGTVHVAGWTIDAGTTEPISVRLRVDGAVQSTTPAAQARADVAATYPEQGADVGFALNVEVAEGSRTLCVDAVNAAGSPGVDTALGCRTVVVKHSPEGAVGTAGQLPGSPLVRLDGWSLDPDVVAPINVDVRVDGQSVTSVKADSVSGQVPASSYPVHGLDHGFTAGITVPEGTRQVCVFGVNAAATPGSTRQHGCRSVVVQHTPEGFLDGVSPVPGQVRVRGWALDPDAVTPVSVRVDVDGAPLRTVTAGGPRTDVARVRPGYGSDLGYSVDLPGLAEGAHQVCATALNLAGTPGGSRLLGCRTAVVRTVPVGTLDDVRTTPGDQAPGDTVVTGWALDPDSTGAIGVHLQVDGAIVSGAAAGLADSRSATAWPGYGDRHGYRFALRLTQGAHRVCTFAINAPGTPGSNPALGCRTVQVQHSPVGLLDPVRTTPGTNAAGTSVVSGWALDPDVTGPVMVHIRVDGVLTTAVTAAMTDVRSGGAWPVQGSAHGWQAALALSQGTHRVCAYGINATGTPGSNPELGCRSVTVMHQPVGQLEVVSPLRAGVLRVSGWALDPDTTVSPTVHVYVDGRLVRSLPTDGISAVAAGLWPGYGDRHGFDTELVLTPGAHTVCVYGINSAGTPGTNPQLGCRATTVSAS